LGAVAVLSALSTLMIVPVERARAAASPRIAYMLDCQGCHGANGQGVPGKVPDMRRSVAVLAATAAGRRYLVEVPGAAQSPLSNAGLARVLNWIIHHFSAVPVPKGVKPFTSKEVASYRATPLTEVTAVRRRLLAAAQKRNAPRK